MVDAVTTASPTTAADTATRLASSRTRLATNYETFLALLTTQLRNQDPLSPLDSNQFTQQIVQMTGVEQQLLTNDLLQSLVDRGSGVGDAVSYIGRQVTADSASARLANGAANWTYTLPSAAASATLEIKNSAGAVVWRGAAPSTTAGDHAFAWDGKGLSGNSLPDGTYSLSVAAQTAAGQAVPATTSFTGVVTGVETVNGVTTLVTTAGNAPLTSVRRVAQAAS